eukprot:evm.model.scf_1622.3 EVM.evm.TU.scf_1622.3   scf_1622:24156-26153(-)
MAANRPVASRPGVPFFPLLPFPGIRHHIEASKVPPSVFELPVPHVAALTNGGPGAPPDLCKLSGALNLQLVGAPAPLDGKWIHAGRPPPGALADMRRWLQPSPIAVCCKRGREIVQTEFGAAEGSLVSMHLEEPLIGQREDSKSDVNLALKFLQSRECGTPAFHRAMESESIKEIELAGSIDAVVDTVQALPKQLPSQTRAICRALTKEMVEEMVDQRWEASACAEVGDISAALLELEVPLMTSPEEKYACTFRAGSSEGVQFTVLRYADVLGEVDPVPLELCTESFNGLDWHVDYDVEREVVGIPEPWNQLFSDRTGHSEALPLLKSLVCGEEADVSVNCPRGMETTADLVEVDMPMSIRGHSASIAGSLVTELLAELGDQSVSAEMPSFGGPTLLQLFSSDATLHLDMVTLPAVVIDELAADEEDGAESRVQMWTEWAAHLRVHPCGTGHLQLYLDWSILNQQKNRSELGLLCAGLGPKDDPASQQLPLPCTTR